MDGRTKLLSISQYAHSCAVRVRDNKKIMLVRLDITYKMFEGQGHR